MSDMSDPFSFNTGAVESEYVGNIGQVFVEMGEAHPDMILVAADLGAGPVTGEFVEKFPSRPKPTYCRWVRSGLSSVPSKSVLTWPPPKGLCAFCLPGADSLWAFSASAIMPLKTLPSPVLFQASPWYHQPTIMPLEPC